MINSQSTKVIWLPDFYHQRITKKTSLYHSFDRTKYNMPPLPAWTLPNEQKVNWISTIEPSVNDIGNIGLHRSVAIVRWTIVSNVFRHRAERRHLNGYLIYNAMLSRSPAVHESVPHSVFIVLQWKDDNDQGNTFCTYSVALFFLSVLDNSDGNDWAEKMVIPSRFNAFMYCEETKKQDMN